MPCGFYCVTVQGKGLYLLKIKQFWTVITNLNSSKFCCSTILWNILTLKVKPLKLILRHLYEKFLSYYRIHCTGLMIMASHRTFSSQIKCMSGEIEFGQTNILYTLSMKILWSLQKKMNVWTIFSPYHKHWLPLANSGILSSLIV